MTPRKDPVLVLKVYFLSFDGFFIDLLLWVLLNYWKFGVFLDSVLFLGLKVWSLI
jgi:hypothetical protein